MYFSNTLLFTKIDWVNEYLDTIIEQLEKMLKERAIAFLSSAAKTNKQLLIEGKANHTSAFDVLPLMDIGTRSYNLFIYEELWIKKNYTVEIVLLEFEKFATISESNQHFLLGHKLDAKAENILIDAKLSFIKQYKKYLIETFRHLADSDFSMEFDFPFRCIVTQSFFDEIEFLENDSARITLQTQVNGSWQELCVYLYLEKLELLLKENKQEKITTRLLDKIKQFRGGVLRNKVFRIKNVNQKFLECNIPFLIMQMEDEHDELEPISPSAYILTDLFTKQKNNTTCGYLPNPDSFPS